MSEKFTCPPDHVHGGSLNCYKTHGCKCLECLDNLNAYSRGVYRAKAYGIWDQRFVGADSVLDHLEQLRQHSMSARTITRMAHISGRLIPALLSGEATRLRRDSAERLLAVRPDLSVLRPQQRVPSRGFYRRLHALQALGWSKAQVCSRIGVGPTNLPPAADFVQARTMRSMIRVYEEMWNDTPPISSPIERSVVTRSKSIARKHGWTPPLGWDDIDTDPTPPLAEADGAIDEVAVELATQGIPVRLSPAERRAAVVILHGRRYSDVLIAATLQVADRTVLRIRGEELHLPAHELNESVHRSAA